MLSVPFRRSKRDRESEWMNAVYRSFTLPLAFTVLWLEACLSLVVHTENFLADAPLISLHS